MNGWFGSETRPVFFPPASAIAQLALPYVKAAAQVPSERYDDSSVRGSPPACLGVLQEQPEDALTGADQDQEGQGACPDVQGAQPFLDSEEQSNSVGLRARAWALGGTEPSQLVSSLQFPLPIVPSMPCNQGPQRAEHACGRGPGHSGKGTQ